MNNNRHCNLGDGRVGEVLVFIHSNRDLAFFLLDLYEKLQKENSYSSCALSLCEALLFSVCSLQKKRPDLDCGLLSFICSSLILSRQTFHCTEYRGCWNQRLRLLGKAGVAELTSLPAPTLSSISWRSIRAHRAT